MNLRKKIFLLIVIVTIIFSLIIKSPISLVPLIYIILSIIVSFIYLLLIKNSCRVVVDSNKKKMFKRLSKEIYNVKIINKSILIFPKVCFSLQLENIDGDIFKKYDYNFMLNPREEKNLEIEVEFPHIGMYAVKIVEVQIYGILDLFCLKYKPKWKEEIFVTPKIYPIEDFDIDTRRAIFPVNFTVPYKIDGEIYDDIREYIPGDPIKNIHWKLSAHANEYMTRILTTDAVSGVTIYLDFCSKNSVNVLERSNLNDAIVEIAYALSLYAIKNDRGVSLAYSEDNNPTFKVPNSILDLREKVYSLPKVSVEEIYPIELLVSQYGNSNSSLDNMFVITNNISVELISILTNFLDKGKRPILCLVEDELKKSVSEEMKKMLKDSSIEYYIAKSAKDFINSLGGALDVKDK
ncbi:DUF58 domain-containing protein [Clostridium sporogenes]